MCWNERVSLNTYIVALFGTIFALANGFPAQIIIALHIFSCMQLVEYFIWKNLDNTEWNQFFSLIGLIILVLEPVTAILLIEHGIVRNTMLLLYCIFIALLLYLYYPWKPYTRIAKNKHLQWDWWPKTQQFYLIMFVWGLFLLLPIFLAKYYILLAFSIITAIISYITYYVAGTAGSMWCWIANGIWLFIIGYIAADKCFENVLCKK
jgi:hypothetical protein